MCMFECVWIDFTPNVVFPKEIVRYLNSSTDSKIKSAILEIEKRLIS